MKLGKHRSILAAGPKTKATVQRAIVGVRLIEALEGRVLLAAHPAAIWHINGDLHGRATDDVIEVHTSTTDANLIEATINGKPAGTRRADRIRGITISGRKGNDTITVNVAPDINVTIKGGPGDDVISGGPERDFIWGGLGNDTINGGGGADVIHGDGGDNTISGGHDRARDIIFRNAGDKVRSDRFDDARLVIGLDRSASAARRSGPGIDGPINPGGPMLPVNDPTGNTVVDGGNAFAWDLYSRLSQANAGQNMFFSPYSISSALAMCYTGAAGATADQMRAVLHLPADKQELLSEFAALNAAINGNAALHGYALSVANALWGQEGKQFLDSFLTPLQSSFGAGLQQLDFASDPESARQTINDWVAGKTNNRIQNLFPPGSIDTLTRLVLANAIYFKADWQVGFDPQQTYDQQFHLTSTQDESVPMMHETEGFQYLHGDGFKLLELPYTGNSLSMVILLPDQVDGLSNLEQSLTAANVDSWIAAAYPSDIALTLPKFTMTLNYDLASTLKAMGMSAPFDANAADFSGMDGAQDLHISAVLHKAFIEVNESGTEAAAATGIGMGTTSYNPNAPPPPIPFVADHPFVFMIRDNASGAILFSGRVMNPSGT